MTNRLKACLPASLILAVLILSPTSLAQKYTPTAQAPNLQISSNGYQRMTFDRTGTRLAVSLKKTEAKGRVVILNVPDLVVIQEVHTDAEPGAISFSHQGDLFAVSLAPADSGPDMSFSTLSTRDWKPVFTAPGVGGAPSSILFDPVGDFVFLGMATPGKTCRFVTGSWQMEKIPSLTDAAAPCRSMAMSKDARYVAIGTADFKLVVWRADDTDSPVTLGTRQFTGSVNCVAFNQDSNMLAAGDAQGNVMVFYLTNDGLWAWKSVFKHPNGSITGVAFMRDQSLVTASMSGVVSRWNIDDTSRPVEEIPVGPKKCDEMAVDPNGRWLALGGEGVTLFPLGSPEGIPMTDMPSAPVNIVQNTAPDPGTLSRPVATIDATSPDAPPPAPVSEDHGNLLLWEAPGKNAGDPQDWIQGWAGYIDDDRYSPLQLILPYETQSEAVLKSNLSNISKVLTPRDFSIFYAGGVIQPTKEASDFVISFGPLTNTGNKLSDVLKCLQTSASIAPTIWVLDLQPAEGMDSALAERIFQKLVMKTKLNDDMTPRMPIGAGLVTFSSEGVYEELSLNVADALSGKADLNGDSKIMDIEVLKYLSERCRSAILLQVIGQEQNTVPILPQFTLGGQ